MTGFSADNPALLEATFLVGLDSCFPDTDSSLSDGVDRHIGVSSLLLFLEAALEGTRRLLRLDALEVDGGGADASFCFLPVDNSGTLDFGASSAGRLSTSLCRRLDFMRLELLLQGLSKHYEVNRLRLLTLQRLGRG